MGELYQRLRQALTRHQTLCRNFSYLSLLQVVSLGLPLLTYPYLIRVLGAHNYGLVVFARAFIEFFILAVDFGFNVPSARNVALHRQEPDKVSEIVSAVLTLKAAILLLCLLVLLTLTLTVPALKPQARLYLVTMLLGLEGLLYPIWFFQGVEEMRFITYVEVIAKLTTAGLIFLCIQGPDDYLRLPGLQALGMLVGGCFSCRLLYGRFGLRLRRLRPSVLGHYLREAGTFFLSKVAVTVQERINTLVVGACLGAREVAYYDLAVKVVSIAKIPFYILNDTVYPHVARERDMGFVKRIAAAGVGLALVLYLAIALGAGPIIALLGGPAMLAAKPLFPLLGLILPIIALSYQLGNNMLVVMGHSPLANGSEVMSAVFFVVTTLGLYAGGWITMTNLILVYLGANLLILGLRLYFCRRLRLL